MKLGRPANATKFHIFTDTKRSLCLAWMYGGADQEIMPAPLAKHRAYCAKCITRYNKHHKVRK